MLDITSVVTNGYVDPSTLKYMHEKGWTFLVTLPANMAHPHALETDKITIFTKYTPADSKPWSEESRDERNAEGIAL